MLRSLSFAKKILLAAALVVSFRLQLLHPLQRLPTARGRAHGHGKLPREIGTLTASNIQSWLEGRMHLVEGLASQLALLDQPDEANIARQLEQPVFSRNFASVYLGEAASGTFTMRPYDAMPEGYDPRTRAWYKDALAADRLIVTEPFVDAGTGEQILAMSLPVRHAGQLLGVAAGDMKLETLTAILNSLKFDGAGYAFLVSDAGKILLHPDSGLVLKTLAEAYPKGAPNIVPGVHEVELDGRSQFVSFTPVKGLPGVTWYVALVLDRDTAYSMLSEFRTSAIVATLIAVVGIMLLLGMLIRVLMQPLTDMGRAMQDIAQGEGDLTKRLKVTSNDEFGTLANAFNRFVERIHESIREVAGTARQLHDVAQLVVNASNSSMANSDEQSNRTNSVAAAINELGAAAQEIARNAADASHHASDANHQAEDGKQVVEQTIRAMNRAFREDQRLLCQHRGPQQPHGEHRPDPRSDQGHLRADQPARPQRRHRSRARRRGRTRLRGGRRRGAQPGPPCPGVGPADPEDDRGTSDRRPRGGGHHDRKPALQPGGVEIANRAGERLGSVTSRIGEIDSMNQSVATATEEQTAVVDSLNMDITEINTLNQEGVENLQATLRACGELETQAGRLRHLVDSFKI